VSRRPTRTVPTVIIPGWQGSGPGHWQVWLADELAAQNRVVVHPDLPDLDHPRLEPWLVALQTSLSGLPEQGYDVVAHSLGAVLWLHHVATMIDSPRAERVVLVSPPSPLVNEPALAEFLPAPMDIDTVRHSADGTVLVGGTDDPYLPEGIATTYGRPLKIATTVVTGGHINVEDGHGPWPAMLDWCGRDNLAFY
jgi:predicted alpha/beta hydrolase family esterase